MLAGLAGKNEPMWRIAAAAVAIIFFFHEQFAFTATKHSTYRKITIMTISQFISQEQAAALQLLASSTMVSSWIHCVCEKCTRTHTPRCPFSFAWYPFALCGVAVDVLYQLSTRALCIVCILLSNIRYIGTIAAITLNVMHKFDGVLRCENVQCAWL